MAFNQNWSNTPATWATVSSLWGQAYGTGSDSLGLTVGEASAIQRAFASADGLALSAVEGMDSGLTVLQDSIGADTLVFSALESSSIVVVIVRSDGLGLSVTEVTADLVGMLATEDLGSFFTVESLALAIEDWPGEAPLLATSWGKPPSHSDVWVKVPPETSEPW